MYGFIIKICCKTILWGTYGALINFILVIEGLTFERKNGIIDIYRKRGGGSNAKAAAVQKNLQ